MGEIWGARTRLADGAAMVCHDDTLERLTEGKGPLSAWREADLKGIAFRGTADHMIELADLCDMVGGRATLVLEIKSRFDGDLRLLGRMAKVLAAYKGPVAAMSFDSDIVAAVRRYIPALPRGIVAQRRYDDHDWGSVSAMRRFSMAHLLHGWRTQPHFLAYRVEDLPPPPVARLLGCSILTWTVRNEEQRKMAERHADQIIFEGWRPQMTAGLA
jgi:glycerophosphoryl diester phosphodiesterase